MRTLESGEEPTKTMQPVKLESVALPRLPRPLSGSWAALPTPFQGGALDLPALARLVDLQLAGGTTGLVVAGTTGEAPTLTDAERETLLGAVRERVAGRAPVMMGVGTNATATTVEHARRAAVAGADALLVVTPYYNLPSPAGLLAHYSRVADAVDRPVVLYNVPTRTGVDLAPATAAELARRHANVVAIKDAVPDLARARALRDAGLTVLCGCDGAIADWAAADADGAVGVVTNLAPRTVADLLAAAAPGGDEAHAARLVEELAPLLAVLYLEGNPVPLKAALALLGLCRAEVREPLAPVSEENLRRIEAALRARGMIAA